MELPPKRRPNRSERRAAQRGSDGTNEGDAVHTATQFIPAPPDDQCEAWHYYWCPGHEEWHHHDESAVVAIQQTLTPNPTAE